MTEPSGPSREWLLELLRDEVQRIRAAQERIRRIRDLANQYRDDSGLDWERIARADCREQLRHDEIADQLATGGRLNGYMQTRDLF